MYRRFFSAVVRGIIYELTCTSEQHQTKSPNKCLPARDRKGDKERQILTFEVTRAEEEDSWFSAAMEW